MNTFLKNTAQDLYTRYGEEISKLCIVFPNRRAALYFKKYLFGIVNKPLWSPETTTINDLMRDISGLQLADNIKLLFELYKVYSKIKKSNESFDEFYFWGEMLLNDFDDIDKYLVHPEDLFKNLKNLKSIQDQFEYLSENQINAIQEFWKSFNLEQYSAHQLDFISIWNVLFEIYFEFNKVLCQNKIAYEGMIYKSVVDKIKSNNTIDFSHNMYVFVGFNALNNCEKALFDHLKNNKKAEFYWDYDELYINNENYEAGLFLRENIKTYKSPPSFILAEPFKTLSTKKNIEIISVSSDVGQAKYIQKWLSENQSLLTDSPDNTAIILSDEQLLIPVIHSVPDTIENVNITMGYPVINTPIYSLLEHLIDLQKNCRVDSTGEIQFSYKNVLAILNHQYIRSNFQDNANELINYINSNNRFLLSAKELAKNDFFGAIFKKAINYSEISEYLLSILHAIYNTIYPASGQKINHSASIEKEYIYTIYLSINRINEVLTEQNIDIKIDTYIRLLRKIVRNLRIPFTGEPLNGLQVMGILETRLLDFENLFILSMNEGVFPKAESSMSFVPYNLRKGFGLPTIEHQDAIYGYYFYRLLQRAKNVTLVYNSNTDGMQTGEMSRFIYQLKFDSDFTIKEKSIRYDISSLLPEPIAVVKSNHVLSELNKYIVSDAENHKYLSPSALTTYLKCKLRFYYRYIANLEEQEDISEQIDAPMFGNILHQAMFTLYKPYLSKVITAEILQNLLKNDELINEAIDLAFNDEYFKAAKKSDYSGRNIIVRSLIEKYIRQIIKVDVRYAPFEMISMENKFEISVPVHLTDKTVKINLGGKIDRIDKQKEQIRIIDYKTGSDKMDFKNVGSLFGDKLDDQNSAVFQTFLYSKFFTENANIELPIVPGIYSVRKLFTTDFDYHIILNADKTKTLVADYRRFSSEFDNYLSKLVEEIFNPSVEFIQTDEIKICINCPYKQICQR
ncbi:MAG: PD-(D/E)XK nuclease family protein [Bacteroidales bacterium]